MPYPPFIYSVQPGNLFKLSDPNVFFVHSFAVGSFRYPTPSPCHLIYISILFPQFFKMGRRPLCPDDKKPKKKEKKARRAEQMKPSDTVWMIGVDPPTMINVLDCLLQMP